MKKHILTYTRNDRKNPMKIAASDNEIFMSKQFFSFFRSSAILRVSTKKWERAQKQTNDAKSLKIVSLKWKTILSIQISSYRMQFTCHSMSYKNSNKIEFSPLFRVHCAIFQFLLLLLRCSANVKSTTSIWAFDWAMNICLFCMAFVLSANANKIQIKLNTL